MPSPLETRLAAICSPAIVPGLARTRVLLPLLGGVLGAAFLVLMAWRASPNIFDEGFAAYNAWIITQGGVPYRDFWNQYMPGSFYAGAGALALFGDELWVLRALDIFWRLALAMGSACLAWHLGAGRSAWLVYAASLAYVGTMGFYGYSAVPAVLFMQFAVLASLQAERRSGDWGWVIATGALLGLVAFMRHDFGAYLAVALAAWALLTSPWGNRRASFLRLCVVGAVAGLVLGILFWHSLSNAGLELIYERLIVGPLKHEATRSGVLLPTLREALWGIKRLILSGDLSAFDKNSFRWIGFWGGVAMLAAGLRSIRDHVQSRGRARLLVMLVGLSLIAMARSRPDTPHYFAMLSFAWPLGVMAVASLPGLQLRRIGVAAFALIFIILPPILVESWKGLEWQGRQMKGARGIRLDPDQAAAALWVKENTPEQSRILLVKADILQPGPQDILFYFLAQRQAARLISWSVANEYEDPAVQATLEPLLKGQSLSAVILWGPGGMAQGEAPEQAVLASYGSRSRSFGPYEVRLR